MVGASAAASAISGNPVLVGGSDATNARALLVDTSGRPLVSGAAAAGSAAAGNPVLSGGTDGTNARSMLVDSSGRQLVSGAAAAGSAIAGNPVLMGLSDATNARALLGDTAGRVQIVGAAAAAAAIAGNPVAVGGYDGTNAQYLRSTTGGVLRVQQDFALPVTGWSSNVFTSLATTGVLLKSGAAIFRALQVINNTGGNVIAMLFDRTTAPSNSAVPVLISGTVASGAVTTLVAWEGGVPFGTGLYLILSTTLTTLTQGASTAATGIAVFA